MGRGRVEENTDEYVNYDQKTSCAKKSLKKFHFGSHPLGGVCALSVASAISGGLVAGDPALAVSSYLAHTPTDIIDPLITTQTSVTVHGSSRAAIRQADTPDDHSRNPDSSLARPGGLQSCLTADVQQQQSTATAPHGTGST
jgi:hypothetical protein